MHRLAIYGLLATAALLTANNLRAAVVTIEGTIKSVDAVKRTITIETGSESKTLDVSSKVKVSVEAKEAALDVLKTGQKVKLSYHDDLEIVLSVTVGETSPEDSIKPAELLEVSELNEAGGGTYPWLSPDGLTVYWDKLQSIWTAQREDRESLFKKQKALFKGRHATVSADGLQMVLLVDGVMHATMRKSAGEDFRRPSIIAELRDQPKVKNPCLSRDGLKLSFNRRGSQGAGFVVSTRATLSSRWEAPKRVPIRFTGSESQGSLTWLSISDDELTPWCSHEGGERRKDGIPNLMMWTRASTSEPFDNFQYHDLPDIEPLIGKSPRYVAATHELFFTRMQENKESIWVVRNFMPPQVKK